MVPASDALFTRRAWLAGCAAAAAGLAWPSGAVAQTSGSHVALVIGNAAYRQAPLRNPVIDATAVAARLRQLGYEVSLKENTSQRELIEALREFSLRATKAAVRVVFYAGHGVQVKGRNYLVPVDANPQTEDELARQSADVGELVERLSAMPQGANVVVLDACRVNPFGGGIVVDAQGRRLKFRGATPPGLARLEAPLGTLLAFSTAPNGIAMDGPAGQHSVYTRHLLAQLAVPAMPVEQLFKRIRVAVADETSRAQVPWESTSLTADFCFRPDAQGQCTVAR
jgi:uncharacterized caspase-like protein